jgi:hypothetical protein
VPHFRSTPAQQHNCKHCGRIIHLYRGNVWRDSKGLSLCLKAESRRHEPYDS